MELKNTTAIVLAFLMPILGGVGRSYARSTDIYDLKMSLTIPRVYANDQSLGYRQPQRQTISGKLVVDWVDGKDLPDVSIEDLVNKTHKLSNGENVTYDCYVTSRRLNAIGSNKTQSFKKATVIFDIEAMPNYAIEDMAEDNSLYVRLSGFGKMSKSVKKGSLKLSNAKGTVGGQIGCSCMAYGHTSPTRSIGEDGPMLDAVDDIAAVEGRWSMKYNKKISRQHLTLEIR